MFELLNETLFEKHIAEYLAGSKMYNQRTPKDFNIQKLVDSDMLLQFLREQPMWQKLITQSFADEQDALNIVIETINTKINRGESLLSLLKNGFMLQGRRIRLAAFKPKMTLDDDDADHLYKKNIFSVVRQMKYSTQGFDKDNELDLCILLKRSAYHYSGTEERSYRSDCGKRHAPISDQPSPTKPYASHLSGSLRHG